MVVSDLRMHLLRSPTQTHIALWGHRFHVHACTDCEIHCHICCAFYIWAGPHTGVLAATWNALGDGLNRIGSDADSIKEMNHTAMNKTFVFGTRMTCPCGFCGEGNVSYVDDFQEKCAGGVLARQREHRLARYICKPENISACKNNNCVWKKCCQPKLKQKM